MRLKPDEIKKLAQHSIDSLLKEKGVTAKVSRGSLIDAVVGVLTHHFEDERKLEADAESLYRQSADQFEGLDKSKAMSRIRQQLATERDFVLSGAPDGRFSQDKLIHVAHLIDDKLYDDDLVDFPDEDDGIRFFKKLVQAYFARESDAEEKARKKVQSLANAPFEGSREWDVLFRKYLEEELRRMGHS